MNPPRPELITTLSDLEQACERLGRSSWLAMDTEFLREQTYYPRLCLIQVADANETFCIDPLAIDDLSPFFALLDDPTITKVMHACRQDMEIVYHLRGHLPSPIFDTQIAAPLLGHPVQAGYARLVEDILGIHLDKTQTRSNWCHRPLSEKQIAYAGDDVHFLGRIYLILREQLERRSRLDWLTEDFAALSEKALYDNRPEDAWRRIRAAKRLRPRELVILRALAAWRETTARERNLPRSWLLKDDCLVDLCLQKPRTSDDLASIRGIRDEIVRRYSDEIVALIGQAEQSSPPSCQSPRHEQTRLSPRQEAVVDALLAIVQLRAAENDLNPQVVTTRKELARLVTGETDIGLLQGWKRRLVGDELVDFLTGRRELRVEQGKLQTQPS